MVKNIRCLADNMNSTISKFGDKGYYVKRIYKEKPSFGLRYVLIQFEKEQ